MDCVSCCGTRDCGVSCNGAAGSVSATELLDGTVIWPSKNGAHDEEMSATDCKVHGYVMSSFCGQGARVELTDKSPDVDCNNIKGESEDGTFLALHCFDMSREHEALENVDRHKGMEMVMMLSQLNQ